MTVFRDDRLARGLLVVTVLAVLTAGWFATSWLLAANDNQLAYGRERDAVLVAASEGLITLHTVDFRTAARDLDAWNRVTAEPLHGDLADDRDGQLKRASATRTVSTAAFTSGAVTDLDKHAGTARVIAVLDVRLSTDGGKPATERRRVNADLVRTDAGWKVSRVEAAA